MPSEPLILRLVFLLSLVTVNEVRIIRIAGHGGSVGRDGITIWWSWWNPPKSSSTHYFCILDDRVIVGEDAWERQGDWQWTRKTFFSSLWGWPSQCYIASKSWSVVLEQSDGSPSLINRWPTATTNPTSPTTSRWWLIAAKIYIQVANEFALNLRRKKSWLNHL